MALLIVGLGNPDGEYEGTRHNVGRWCVQGAAKNFEATEWKLDGKLKALTAKGKIGKKLVQYVLPNNFMNNSGGSLVPLVKSAKAAADTVVVYDDLDLPLGTVKISFDRGDGGHRGLESIIKKLKTRAFARIRVGICPTTPGGKPKKPQGEDAVIKFILGKFSDKERDTLKKVAKVVREAIELIATEGREKATGAINSKN